MVYLDWPFLIIESNIAFVSNDRLVNSDPIDIDYLALLSIIIVL